MAMKKRLITFISGAVTLGILVTASTSAFASQDNKTLDNKGSYLFVKADNKDKGHGLKCKKGNEDFKAMLSELVKNGTITQSEADKITSYLNSKQEQRKAEMEKIKGMTEEQRKQYFSERKSQRKDLLSELVESNIITQAKADAIKSKMKEKNEAKRQERIKEIESGLNSLVQKGTITKEQANKVIENMKSKHEERKALMEKTRNMTPEERKAYFEKLKGERNSFLNEMVDKKELTKEQADAIKQMIKGFHKKDK